MKKCSKATEKPERSIFSTIFISVLAILVIEVVLLIGSIAVSRVPSQLNTNAEDILAKQVENRSSYLESFLVQAQSLGDLPDQINAQAEALLAAGTISKDTLGTNSAACEPLLEAISDEVVTQLRSSSVTGVFVVLSTSDLEGRRTNARLPGLYVRDLDPDALPSERNEDLMLEFAPAALVKSMRISTDSAWQPALDFEEVGDFVREPYMAAYRDESKLLPAQYGRWTASPYTLSGDTRTAVAYSEPLILSDGTVYGVVGVELLTSYLSEQLPIAELQNDNMGSYMLAETTGNLTDHSLPLQSVLLSGRDDTLRSQKGHITFTNQSGNGTIIVNGQRYFASAQQLTLYDRNAPFSEEHWMLLGIVPTSALYRFSTDMQTMLLLAVFLTMIVGLLSSYFISRGLAHPIKQLSDEVAAVQDKSSAIPRLSRTGIRELDRFSTAITQLSRDILDTSTKFLRIMDMASIELGGYEIRDDSDKVFVTENFFSMLGMHGIDIENMTEAKFESLMEDLVLQNESTGMRDGGCVFTIPQPDGSERFVMLRITCERGVQVGLLEDVTAATIERRRIEHERDYDVLTGLYNRRAFDSKTAELFRMPEKLRCAALLMMDMDNLKHINDTFGHDWGDRYINLAGRCFADALPESNTICARLSGDEFIVLFYGYSDSDQIRAVMQDLREEMKMRTALLPDGGTMHISISGGIAWYPENGGDMATLKKYADFAMYQVKRAQKGAVGEFDIGAYNQEAYAAQMRSEFLLVLRESRVNYHFQPIFSALTGQVAAYEALMRIEMPILNSPLTVMKLAREMDKLYEVEHLTAFKASETFVMMRQNGRLHEGTKLFLNSIANISLTDEDIVRFKEQFGDLMDDLVIEITEEEEMDHEALDRKRAALGGRGALALDDWGSGYSNSSSLLELAPNYIKVDITIIRDIDTDPDKQQLVSGIVDYAHRRDMKIVAEGIETEAELRKVIELGVDLLQGYFLAKPAASPSEIAPDALTVIHRMNHY